MTQAQPLADAVDRRWLATAMALGARAWGLSRPNPNVGCLLVRDGAVVGRGWTSPGGRPHAEAAALAMAGTLARGATAYVSLEPCAHVSARGPACADALIAAGVARVVSGVTDPDPRTAGAGHARLRAAGIAVTADAALAAARASIAPWWSRQTRGRPLVTLKLALSLDGAVAMADGSSRWITGPAARAHAHLERARHDAILVGRGTLDRDTPRLDVRLPGLESRSPARLLLTRGGAVPDGWHRVASPQATDTLDGVDSILVEGGAGAAAAFLAAGRVDRLLIYRAPILVGGGRAVLGDIGLARLGDAHGRWRQADQRQFGPDRLDIYQRTDQG